MIAVHMTRILYFVLLFVALSNAASDESTDDQVMASSSILTPERRIELNPFDIDAWNLILRESQARPIDQARNFYEKLVTQFPNAGRYWKAYIEHELACILRLFMSPRLSDNGRRHFFFRFFLFPFTIPRIINICSAAPTPVVS
ncbi:hypothetical protein KIN20_002113 [Parelaphostrongylus tenuis]|uniref:Suppressor of forked domain-containing protein n=1 Tax=Parelaphostrongylus tenuis TaxID=148309 RepID=A0AAD5MDP3_PARTN|nr:hypothetical protein KIN20_002113 [Parelaphostrongylus tenuis]